MGVSQNVVTFTESDFGRTLQPSGGSTLGTDHAWGSHHFIMGDAVKGGDLLWHFPDAGFARDLTTPTIAVCGFPRPASINMARRWRTGSASIPRSSGTVFPNLANFAGLPLPAFL